MLWSNHRRHQKQRKLVLLLLFMGFQICVHVAQSHITINNNLTIGRFTNPVDTDVTSVRGGFEKND